ncbi:MAG: hypothetical protein ABFS32_10265 [Bacteroidota bacterium]
MRITNRTLVAFLIFGLFHTLSNAQTISLGETELIYTDDEIPIRYDGSLSTIRWDDQMHFFHSFGCRFGSNENRRSRHSWYTGTPLDPLKTHLGSKEDHEFWDYNGYYSGMETEGIWILGMYKHENGNLLAITHSEVTPDSEKQGDSDLSYTIGLGYSTDKGKSWVYCGDIIRAADKHTNVGGGAYIVKDDYLYVYYNDTDTVPSGRHPAVARAKLKDIIEMASQGKVGKWMKYKDGNWGTPGLSDIAGSSIFPLESGWEDLHSDAAYCTALGKYLLTVQTHDENELLLYSSADGVEWEKEAVIDVAGKGEMQPYSSFVDFDSPSDDCSTVSGDFYIYFPRKKMNNHDHDYMYRRRITIE